MMQMHNILQEPTARYAGNNKRLNVFPPPDFNTNEELHYGGSNDQMIFFFLEKEHKNMFWRGSSIAEDHPC